MDLDVERASKTINREDDNSSDIIYKRGKTEKYEELDCRFPLSSLSKDFGSRESFGYL